MAAISSSPVMVDAVAAAVEELAIKVTEPPKRYIAKEKIDAADEIPLLDVPCIDVSLLSSSSLEGKEELNKLRLALSSCGYFQGVNHGVPTSFIDEVHDTIRGFFHLPMKEKKKYARSPDDFSGYGKDTVYSEDQVLDWHDRLYLIVHPEEQRKIDKWPQNPENFREMLFELSAKLAKVNEEILRAMAKSLNLEENSFTGQLGESPIVLSRFNHYSPCPRPELVIGAKAHGDASATTFLLQDKEVEGLQALKDDKWFKVPIIPDAILVNVGDQIEIMSNGIFKSPIHRVVTNPKRERITTAIFFSPDTAKNVHPAEGLIDEKTPRLYKDVTDYTGNYFYYAQQGKRPIDTLRV